MKVPDARTTLISISNNIFTLHYPPVVEWDYINFKNYYILHTGQTEIIHLIKIDIRQFISKILNDPNKTL
jgi:hypothetical protein